MQKQSMLMVSPTPSIGTTDSSDLSSTLLTMITQSAPFPDLPKASTPLSDMQLQHVADMCINSLRMDGIVTQKVITQLIQQGFLLPSLTTPTLTPSTTTPLDRPELLPSDKVPSLTPGHRRLSIHQLHHYIGFRTLKNWHSLINVGQPTIDIINYGTPPLELGDVANIRTSRRNTTPIPCPPNFLDVVHLDIGYGDCKAVEGAKYVILLVDWATRFSWVYALHSLNHKEIISVLQQFMIDAGASPHHIYTDFDPKFLEGETARWFREQRCKLRAAPSGRQNQNGLVERTFGWSL